MGMEKAIQSGKERRKPYRGSKAFDCTCRNHGSCDWCKSNRMHSTRKRLERIEEEINENRSI